MQILNQKMYYYRYKVSKRRGRIFTSINKDFNEDEVLKDDINKNFGKKKTLSKSKNYIQDMMNYEVKLIDLDIQNTLLNKIKKRN